MREKPPETRESFLVEAQNRRRGTSFGSAKERRVRESLALIRASESVGRRQARLIAQLRANFFNRQN
jgi:hypothetical protein